MRHLGSVLLAPVLALVALVLAGRGLVGLAQAVQESTEQGRTDIFGLAAAGSAVGLAGLLFALLTMARLSPLGPGLAGAGYVAVGVWALADQPGFLAAVPGDLIGFTDDQLLVAAMIAPLLAFPLLVTFFIPRRWVGKERPEPAPGGTTYGTPTRATTTLDDLPPVPAAPAAPPPPVPAAPPPPPSPVPSWPSVPQAPAASPPPPPDETTVTLPQGNPPVR